MLHKHALDKLVVHGFGYVRACVGPTDINPTQQERHGPEGLRLAHALRRSDHEFGRSANCRQEQKLKNYVIFKNNFEKIQRRIRK